MNIFFNPDILRSPSVFDQMESYAVVTDVITNEEHRDYTLNNNETPDGFNVGSIEYKNIIVGSSPDFEEINGRASPLEPGIQEYPLIGEVVLIKIIGGETYYTRRVNVTKNLQYNSYPFLLQSLQLQSSNQASNSIQQARLGIVNRTSETVPSLSNENYSVNENVNLLKSFEGDTIIQGRFGASIRLSSSQIEDALNGKTITRNGKTILGPAIAKKNDPIMILRVGQTPDAPKTVNSYLGLVMEDPNKDSASIILSSKQNIKFKYASQENKSDLSGPQIILNSDKISINARDTDIMSSAKDYIIEESKHIVLRASDTIVLGKFRTPDKLSRGGGAWPYYSAVRGEVLVSILENMIDLLDPGPGTPISFGFAAVPIVPLWSGLLQNMKPLLEKIKSDLVRLER